MIRVVACLGALGLVACPDDKPRGDEPASEETRKSGAGDDRRLRDELSGAGDPRSQQNTLSGAETPSEREER